MNILNPESNKQEELITPDNLSQIQKDQKIKQLKVDRLDLDFEIRGLEEQLKNTIPAEVENLNKIIAEGYARFDAIGEEIKSLTELIKKEDVENERAVDPYKNPNIDAIDVRIKRFNNSDK